MTSPSASPSSPEQFPKGAGWLFVFQSFNAINFTIAMGAPMILLVRFLGGSELHVGIIVALPALMGMLQLVSTPIIERMGYRKIMMVGWGARSLLLLFVAPLPLLIGRYSPELLLGVLITAHVFFTLIRGISSGAWFPWLSQLIPESIRGKFIGIEQRTINVSAFLTLIISGFILQGDDPAPWKYSAMMVFATVIGVTSAFFLGKSPDRPVPLVKSDGKTNRLTRVWKVAKASWKSTPYRRTISYMFLVSLAILPVQGFLVLYIKENLGYTTGETIKFQSLNTLGILLSSVVWGNLCDRYGSKPVLKIAMTGMLLQYSTWLAFSVGAIAPTWQMIMAIQLIWGVLASGHVIATVKMMMGCCPKRDLTTEMSVIQVSISLCAGSAPILIGSFLRWMRPDQVENITALSPGFATVFFLSLLACVGALVQIPKLKEAKAQSPRALLAYMILDWPTRVFRQKRKRKIGKKVK